MKFAELSFSTAHDPRWVARRSRELGRQMGLTCRCWHRQPGLEWLVLQSPPASARKRRRVYLSAGIHGDEAGSVLGLLSWLEQAERWKDRFHFTIIPCLNPWGLRQNSRLDEAHRDLNRTYNLSEVSSTQAHRRLLAQHGPFDLALTLHEDYDAHGMYIYEVTSAGSSWGHDLLKAARSAVPRDDRPVIEGRKAEGRLLQRNLNTPAWRRRFVSVGVPEGVYIYWNHCPRVYTLETPSEFALGRRAAAHLLAINAALKKLT